MLSNFSAHAQRFEELARAYAGNEQALAVSSCDVGLTLAVAALVDEPEGEVILPAFTFNSTANAALWNGLTPRFVDVDPASFCIDPDAVAAAVGERTVLILGTHVFGVPCPLSALEAIASRAGMPLLFDAAHAYPTFFDDRHVSHWGDASAFSFGGTKVVTSGEGGLVTFRSRDAAERFRRLRNHGFLRDYVSHTRGMNGKLSELHAALGCLNMERIEDDRSARMEIDAAYRRRLNRPEVRFQEVPEGARSACCYFALDAGGAADAVVAHLTDARIETKRYFMPLDRMPAFAGCPRDDLSVTDRLARTLVCLPLYPDLSEADVELVCSHVNDCLDRVAA
jgi:dTDP-4-amino-4,6-dideoxygalactose transaminase